MLERCARDDADRTLNPRKGRPMDPTSARDRRERRNGGPSTGGWYRSGDQIIVQRKRNILREVIGPMASLVAAGASIIYAATRR